MRRIRHAVQRYAWGSATAIQNALAWDDPGVIAEAWFGAHPSAPSLTETDDGLDSVVADDPVATLGPDVVSRFGAALPYLLKVIVAEQPLSLQVHPHLRRARAGFEQEEAAGVPRDAAERNYRDQNHKPELVYALTRFEAMSGFRAPRRAAELFGGLDTPLARDLHALLSADPGPGGVESAFTRLLVPEARPTPQEVAELAAACARRLAEGSPSPRSDRTVVELQQRHPGDPGVVTSLLLNPVTLQPGEAMFIPAGGVHAYLSGLVVEIMANSDNVLRAGLTTKHIDVAEVLRNVDYVAAPPIRIAPEVFHGATKVFYAPVDDFELSVTTVGAGAHPLPGRGPRILLCLDGSLDVTSAAGGHLVLGRGQAAFASACDGSIVVSGEGTLVQADVP